MADPILTVLRTKGTEVLAASTSTRVIRRSLRQALEQRDRVCVVPGCGIASGLEIDHLVPFAKGGPTSIENLQRLCKHHHRLKTTGRATLTRWETQDGPRFGWLPRTTEAEPSEQDAETRPPAFQRRRPQRDQQLTRDGPAPEPGVDLTRRRRSAIGLHRFSGGMPSRSSKIGRSFMIVVPFFLIPMS